MGVSENNYVSNTVETYTNLMHVLLVPKAKISGRKKEGNMLISVKLIKKHVTIVQFLYILYYSKKKKKKNSKSHFLTQTFIFTKKPGLLTSFKSRRHHRIYLIFCR